MAARSAKTDRAALVARHLRSLELGKKHYKKADAALAQLAKEMTPGEKITLPSGKVFEFRDKFEGGKISINVGQNARRYEFEEVTAV